MDETKITALAVNDNPDHLYLQEVMLRQVGYNVLTASDGREAFDLLKRERVDIIISDVMMPGVDGIDLCRLVRSHPTLHTLPIFLVSALRKDADSVVEGLRAGADDYLEHPFQPMAFAARVTRLVERKRSDDQRRRLNEELEVRVAERTAQLARSNEELEREANERRFVESALEKARDAALEGARLKSEFLANVSHELRTPMHVVTGMAGLLLKTPLRPRQREYVESIMEGAQSLLDIINDVLDLSKIEAGKLRIDKVDFEVADVVSAAEQMFSERAWAKGLKLTSSIAEDVPEVLQGDPGRLRQIITNLLSNAVKFTESGQISLRVSLAAEAGPHTTLRFEVADTGIGVSPESTRRIFLPFAQADGSDARGYGGTGLGLAICRQLVELIGGEIGVESEFGRGSTFWFTVKLGKPTGRYAAVVEDSGLDGMRALVVNHESENRESLLRQAREWNMHADAADNTESASELLSEAESAGQPFDFVLVELHAPGAGAIELARRVRADARLKATRLILIASRVLGGEEDEDCDESLFDACLVPPMRRQQLYECLRSLAGGGGANKPTHSAGHAAQPPSAARVAILVAEDNPVNRRLVVYMLEELGYEAVVVEDGARAVIEHARGRYRLVLMDCQMPLMDGYAAVAEIRRREGEGQHTPVVALTADAMKGTRERCLAAGMDDYLSKPFTTEQLGAVIAKWLHAVPESRPDADESFAEEEAEDVALDLRLLERLGRDAAGGDGGRTLQLVETFLSDVRARSRSIHEACALRDLERIRREAHALKGGAGLFGAVRLSKICVGIIEQATRGDLPEVRRSLEEFEAELAQVTLKLEQWKPPSGQ